MTTSVGNDSVFRSFFEKQKLIGPNFIDWYRQLCLVLSTEDTENYLEHHIPAAPVAPPRQQVLPQAHAAHAAWVKGKKEELKAMYSKQAEEELMQTVREFHTSKQEEGQPISTHVLKIKGYIDNLERVGQPVGQNFIVSLILVSLNKDFDSFVQNYNMHGMGKTVNELHAMLNPKNQKNKPRKVAKGSHGKGKGKIGYASNNAPFAPKLKTPPPPNKGNPAKTPFSTNVVKLGTGEGTVSCLRGSKKLKPGALSLYVGDAHRAAIEAIGTYHLELPSGLVIVLNNYHYAPSITRGVISVLRLFND
nr:hypothetical protein [Tanacetum cinerariifolium]GEZ80385.1 hypothetical protein [Tanacetum cinerariifolium]